MRPVWTYVWKKNGEVEVYKDVTLLDTGDGIAVVGGTPGRKISLTAAELEKIRIGDKEAASSMIRERLGENFFDNPARRFQRNNRTGERRYSDDGGKTWQPVVLTDTRRGS